MAEMVERYETHTGVFLRYHIAPDREFVPTVYASLKYRRDSPPESIEIDGVRYKREDGE